MSGAAALGATVVGGLASGRLAAVIAGRFTPPRTVRRRIPVVEPVMATASVAVVARFGIGWTVIPPLVAAAALVTLSAVDLRAYRLPDAITLPALGASLAAVGTVSVVVDQPSAVVSALGAALGYGAVLWAAHELHPRGLGFGDVKLAPLLGLHLGWVAGTFHEGWSAVFGLVAQALLLSSLIGLSTGLGVAWLRRRGHDVLPDPDRGPADSAPTRLLDTGFPFGPALSSGTMAAVVFSGPLLG